MNIYTFTLIVVTFLLAFIYMVVKRQKINALNKGIQQKDAMAIKTVLNQSVTQRMLSSYVLDLYMAAALRIESNYDALKQHLVTMTENAYSENEEQQYLSLYFHFFMIREEYNFAYNLLDKIHKISDQRFIKCCDSTYRVLANNERNLIEEMRIDIDNKMYEGFELAVITYLIAVQYTYQNNEEKALEWYEIALSVFQPKDLYVARIKKILEIKE